MAEDWNESQVALHEASVIDYENKLKVLDDSSATIEDACAVLVARANRLTLMNQFCREDPSLTGAVEALRHELDEEATYGKEINHWKSLLKTIEVPSRSQESNYVVDVDAFFDEYPECIRPNWDTDVQYETIDTKEEEEVQIVEDPGPAKKAEALPPPKRNQPVVNNLHNPYAAPSNNSEVFSYTEPPQNNMSWEEHESSNPFQTARDFAKVELKEDTTRHQPNKPRTVYRNPYEKPAPPPPPVPQIRDSLKRKFQPPKKGTVTSNPPPSNTQGNVQKQKPQNSDSEEDELPEELKRFGKELVEKIESEIMDNGESVTFDDIAGLEDVKQTIQEVICWPMKRPDLFTGLRRAPNGLLLYGPPGTGKTLIGKAIAHESGATFFSISSSSLTSKWIGEGEKLVRTLFAVAAYREPAVVFIDEIDSLLTQRKADENEASRRIKTEFLVQLDGTSTAGQGRVLVIGATNRPQELDEAARRRFIKRLYIPLPEKEDRKALLNVLLVKNNHCLQIDDVEKLAVDTAGFSGADLKALCADAAMGPIRQLGPRALEVDVKDVPPISYKHFRKSLRGTKPSVAPSDLQQYIEWDKIYGSRRSDDDDEDSDED